MKEYIKSIDFDLVDDFNVLDNVYGEIKGKETKLILDFEVSNCMEQLISKSSISQILNLVKNIDLLFVINKKSGSKVFETIFKTIFNKIKEEKIKKDLYKRIKMELMTPIYESLELIVTNTNGAFALRKYFEYANVEEFNFTLQFLNLLDTNLSVETIITILVYLKFNYSKRIARRIVEKYLNLDYLKTPSFSFIFEDLIQLGDKKTLEIISKFVIDNFKELGEDKYANYVSSKIVQRMPKRNELYFQSLCENINSNVVLKIFENYCKEKNTERIREILEKYFQIEENVFYELLLSTQNGINTKFVDSVVCLMDLEEDVFGINSDFVKFYKEDWLNKKCGIKLTKGFLEGGGSIKLKKQLIGKINITQKLIKKKDGVKIQNLVKSLKRVRGV